MTPLHKAEKDTFFSGCPLPISLSQYIICCPKNWHDNWPFCLILKYNKQNKNAGNTNRIIDNDLVHFQIAIKNLPPDMFSAV